MTHEIWTLLAVNLLLAVVLMSLAALPSLRTKDPSYVDGLWSLGFVAVAISTLLQTSGDRTRVALLVGLCCLWGFRLSAYLLWRWRRNGPDPRYQAMLAAKKRGTDAGFLWTRVFLTQAVILTVVSLPVQLGQVYDHPSGLSVLNVLGAVLALFGIAFESTADTQLARFKADPAHAGQVMDRGLWRNSRHPNYFGEACTWWGLGLLAVVNVPTALTLLGPLLLTGFLLKWSGVGHVERGLRRSKPAYADYTARTSAFVPLPRRL